MKPFSLKVFIPTIVVIAAFLTANRAQESTPPTKIEQTTVFGQADRIVERHHGQMKIRVQRGVTIELGNRTTGRITVTGWDRDEIEARALSERGDEVVLFDRLDQSGAQRLFVKADYANVERPAAATDPVADPPQSSGEYLKVHLEISVPRYTQIELIRVWRSDVQVNGVSTPIKVLGDKSSIVLKDVGGVTVRTRSGNVEIEDSNGSVEVITTSGAVRVHQAKGPVRVVSISGPIEIRCTRGRIDVANTEAPIELVNTSGDVEAVATNSSVRITGRLRDEGRYNLRSLSGRVEMILPSDTTGFDANLSSYRGLVETDFKLKAKQVSSEGSDKRHVIGSFGNGKAQVTLDSFDGLVRLSKVAASSLAACR